MRCLSRLSRLSSLSCVSLALLLTSCLWIDKDELALADADHDGYLPPLDCADDDAGVYPGAIDIIGNDIDEDCDGYLRCWEDLDDDGFGSGAWTEVEDVATCDEARRTADLTGDCSDLDPSIHPNADEPIGTPWDADCDGKLRCYPDLDGDGVGVPCAKESCIEIEAALDCDGVGRASIQGDCDDADEGVGAPELLMTDADADGFGVGEAQLLCPAPLTTPAHGAPLDCRDDLATVHPGAREVPGNDRDDDCNGLQACFFDGDGDLAGTEVLILLPEAPCDGFPNGASRSDDCDDAESTAFVGGEEVAGNGIDEDCDGGITCYIDADGDGIGAGVIIVPAEAGSCEQDGVASFPGDCDDQDLALPRTWYLDADGDGAGDGSRGTLSCIAPPNYVANPDDCDDTAPDLCPQTLWFRDLDGDGFGGIETSTGCEAPASSGWSRRPGDCDDRDSDSSIECRLTQLDAGDQHTCGVRSDGTASCWGVFTQGPPPDVRLWQIATAGQGAACGLTTQGSYLVCWTDGDTLPVLPDISMYGLAVGLPRGASTAELSGCALSTLQDQPTCWGVLDTADVPSDGIWARVGVSEGAEVACAARGTEVRCWGALGDASPALSDTVLELAVSDVQVCVRDPGGITCWEHGGAATRVYDQPMLAMDLRGDHLCAVREADGSEVCTGRMARRVGFDEPAPLTTIVLSDVGTCGLTPTEGAVCWTLDGYPANAPSQRTQTLAAGAQASCGARGHELECWGEGPPLLRLEVASLVGGRDDFCALRPSGGLWCWGASRDVLTRNNERFRSIATSQTLTCAEYDTLGVAGNRQPPLVECINHSDGSTFTPFGAYDNKALDVGASTVCAITSEGRVTCSHGTTPPPPVDDGDLIAVTRGDPEPDDACGSLWPRTCVLSEAGMPECFGYPSPPLPLEPFVQLREAAGAVCGLRGDGSLVCADACGVRETAAGPYLDAVPLRGGMGGYVAIEWDGSTSRIGGWLGGSEVLELPPVIHLATASGVVCGVDTDSRVSCVRDPAPPTQRVPAGLESPWSPVVRWSDVGIGDGYLCATYGTVFCDGVPFAGRTHPLVDSVTSLAVGREHACITDNSDYVTCWGSDTHGQASFSSTASWMVAVGDRHTCAGGSRIECAGDPADGRTSPPTDLQPIELAAGAAHSCARGVVLGQPQVIACWGDDTWGQSSPPPGSDTWTGLTAGAYHTCALDDAGLAHCWGQDHYGQASPPTDSVFTELVAGREHTCGLGTDGVVRCWGRDIEGQASPPRGAIPATCSSF